jgi:hypothetical protein
MAQDDRERAHPRRVHNPVQDAPLNQGGLEMKRLLTAVAACVTACGLMITSAARAQDSTPADTPAERSTQRQMERGQNRLDRQKARQDARGGPTTMNENSAARQETRQQNRAARQETRQENRANRRGETSAAPTP